EVPPGVAAVVRRLMAKRPEDRFQTPAELVSALDQLFAPAPPPIPVRKAEPAHRPPPPPLPLTTVSDDSTLPSEFKEMRPDAEEAAAFWRKRRARGWGLPVACATAAAVVLGVILWVWRGEKPSPPAGPALSEWETIEADFHDPQANRA